MTNKLESLHKQTAQAWKNFMAKPTPENKAIWNQLLLEAVEEFKKI